MIIQLRQVKATGHPRPVVAFEATDQSWKIFTYHSDSHNFFESAKALQKLDRDKFQLCIVNLGKRCKSGQPLKEVYDEKKLHEACKFKFKDETGSYQDDNIYRIRQDDLRLYFIYKPPKKEIILLDVFTKRKDKLSQGEIKRLQNLARSIRSFEYNHDIQYS